MRRVLAVLVGCMVAILVLFVGEMLSQFIYPSPGNVDHADAEELKKLMDQKTTPVEVKQRIKESINVLI